VAQGKRFSPEFRQKAVRLYRVSEQPYRAVAEELAVVPESTGSAERRPRQAVVRSAREEVCRCRTLAETRHAPSQLLACRPDQRCGELRTQATIEACRLGG
jgi:transposase-like protein